MPGVAPLAISMGDPAGIGPEVIAKAWARRDTEALPCFFAVGDVRAISQVWTGPVERIDDPRDAATVFARALPVVSVVDGDAIVPGRPDIGGARCAEKTEMC